MPVTLKRKSQKKSVRTHKPRKYVLPPHVKEKDVTWFEGIGTAWVKLSKKWAKDWMELNDNRNLSTVNMLRLRKQMNKGVWTTNGDTLRFDLKNRFVNGQHTILAFIDSDLEELKVLIVIGLSENAFQYMDGGKKRSIGDHLGKGNQGIVNANEIAAAIKDIYLTENNTPSIYSYGKHNVIDASDSITFAEQNQKIVEDAVVAKKLNKDSNKLISTSTFLALKFLTEKRNKRLSKVFLDRIVSRDGWFPGDPCKAFVSKVLSEKEPGRRVRRGLIYAWAIIAWNHLLDIDKGAPPSMKKIKFTVGKDAIPKMRYK